MADPHSHIPQRGGGRLWSAVALNVALTIVQVIFGLTSGSLALVADALHNLNDAASIGIALLARRIARRPADKRRTYGYQRAELIGALINLTALILVGLYLIFEAIRRMFETQAIQGWTVVIVATVALIVDLITAGLTWSLSRGSLNMRAAFVHNFSDAMASVGVIVSGVLAILYNWRWPDLVATLTISGYILWQGGTMMRSTVRILMDSVPRDIDFDEVVHALEQAPGVRGVHHVHIRGLDERHAAIEAHIVVDHIGDELEPLKHRLRDLLREQFDITHSTLEFEPRQSSRHDQNVVAQH